MIHVLISYSPSLTYKCFPEDSKDEYNTSRTLQAKIGTPCQGVNNDQCVSILQGESGKMEYLTPLIASTERLARIRRKQRVEMLAG